MSGSGADIYSSSRFSLIGANIIQDSHGKLSPAPRPINAAPQLAVLGNYGGPTPTMPPLASSIAINRLL